MSDLQEIEIYKKMCEKLIDENYSYDQETKMELKAIVKSDDCGKIVFERLVAYLSGKNVIL